MPTSTISTMITTHAPTPAAMGTMFVLEPEPLASALGSVAGDTVVTTTTTPRMSLGKSDACM